MPDPLADIDRMLASFGGGEPARPAKRRRRRSISEQELQDTILGLPPSVISGLVYAGETLDKVGAATRGTISGLTGGPWGGGLLNLVPFSDAMAWTDPAKRVYSRDILERQGIAPPNQPGLDRWDLAGFGLDVVTDPITWLTGPVRALNPAGQILKRAGLLSKVRKLPGLRGAKEAAKFLKHASKAKIAAEAAEAAGDVAGMAKYTKAATALARKAKWAKPGKRTAPMLSTLDKFMESLPLGPTRARADIATAAEALGTTVAKVGDQPLGGLIGRSNWPMGRSHQAFGRAGGYAEKVARVMDFAGESIRYSPPVRFGAQLFGKGAADFGSEIGQKFMAEGLEAVEEGTPAIRAEHLKLARQVEETIPHIMQEMGLSGERGYAKAKLLAGEILEDLPGTWPEHMAGFKQQAAQLAQEVADFKGNKATKAYKDLVTKAKKAKTKLKDAVRFEAGGNVKPLDPRLQPLVETYSKIRRSARSTLAPENAAGLPTPEFHDMVEGITGYMPRGLEGGERAAAQLGKAAGRAIPTGHGFQLRRAGVLSGHFGGTRVVQEMSINKAIAGAARQHKSVDDAVKYIKQMYGSRLKTMGTDEWRRLAKMMAGRNADDVAKGLPIFSQDAAGMALARRIASHRVLTMTDKLRELIAAVAQPGTADSGATTVDKMLETLGMTWNAPKNASGAKFRMLQQLQAAGKATKEGMDDLAEWVLPKQYVNEMTRAKRLITCDEALSKLGKATDAFLHWWRSNVTVYWPGYLTRNKFGGLAKNWVITGDSPVATAMFDRHAAHLAKGGKVLPGVLDYPQIKQMGFTDPEKATRFIVDDAASHSVTAAYKAQAVADTAATPELLSQVVGETPFPGVARTAGRAIKRLAKGEGRNPLKTDDFALVEGGRVINKFVEDTNRMGLWLALKKQGWSSAAAAAKTDLAHVAYGAKTGFERTVARRVVPFYGFLSGMFKSVGSELLERPGGRMGWAIRGSQRMGQGQMLPDYLAQTLAIPVPEGTPLIGPQPGGDPRVLGGFGMMWEDPLQFLGGGSGGGDPIKGLGLTARGVGQELISRMGPAGKPLEWAFGSSTFQAGPRGGRLLEDQDPPFGRTLRNIQQLATGDRTRQPPVTYPGSQFLEFLASTVMPRPLTTARTITDPRKNSLAKLVNLGTGARVYDLPERTQDAFVRERAEEGLRGLGGRELTRTWLPPEQRKRLSLDEANEADRFLGVVNLMGARSGRRAKGLPNPPLRTW